jgi:hypothetical protein
MLTKLIYVLGLLITLINTDADSLTTAQAAFQAELTVSKLEAEADFMEEYENDFSFDVELAWLNENQCIMLTTQTIEDIIVYAISFIEIEVDEDGEIDIYDSVDVIVHDDRVIFSSDYDEYEIYGDILVER